MIKVQNKGVIRELARATYRANGKRNLLTVFAIFLTTFLVASVTALGISYWSTLQERNIRMMGMDYDMELSEPREEQIEKLRSMKEIEYVGLSIRCAIVRQYGDKLLDKVRLHWIDETCWEKQKLPAVEYYKGEYPKAKNEIMLSVSALRAMGIDTPEIGMELPLNWYSLAEYAEGEETGEEVGEEAGEKVGEEAEENSEEETTEETEETEQEMSVDILKEMTALQGSNLKSTFRLCGWYLDYQNSANGYVSREFCEFTGVKQTDFTKGTLFLSWKAPFYSRQDIADVQNQLDLDWNQIIRADEESIEAFLKIVAGLMVLFLIILLSGYLFIYNTMYLSVSKDIRYYGQLKTIGMTSKQLKGLVYRQAFWSACIGIPAGLLLAWLVASLAFPKILLLVAPGLTPVIESGNMAQTSWWSFLLAGMVALLTDISSSRKPAQIAGDCSPVEAMRYAGGKTKGRSRREHSLSLSSMAWQNMFRDKKQAAVIFLSFTIAVSMFFIINVVILSNDAKHILNHVSDYDIEFLNETVLNGDEPIFTEEKQEELKAVPGVKQVRRIIAANGVLPYQESYEEYYKALCQSRYAPGNYEEFIADWRTADAEDYRYEVRVVSVDERGFELLKKALGGEIDQEAFERGEIALASQVFVAGDQSLVGKTARFFLSDGKQPEQEYTMTIAAESSIFPGYASVGYTELTVSEKWLREQVKEPFVELLRIEYETRFSRETEEAVKAVFAEDPRVSYDSTLEQYNDMRQSEAQVKVLGNGLGIILAVLAILNYLNVTAASVQNRNQEFATLESIGMTAKQIRTMLRFEGIGYAGISLIASLGAGLPLSFLIFRYVRTYRSLPYAIPWPSNLLLFAVIALLCILAPVVLYQKLQTGSMIERLREKEN